jgi:hypothetical protein
MEPVWPDDIRGDARERLSRTHDAVSKLTVERRVYDSDGAYDTDGKMPMFDSCTVDTRGADIIIRYTFAGSVQHWLDSDYATDVYNVMDSAGISPPTDEPTVGVSFNETVVYVETVLHNALK